jgi:hypothetical protein
MSKICRCCPRTQNNASDSRALLPGPDPELMSQPIFVGRTHPTRPNTSRELEPYMRAALLKAHGEAPEQIFRPSSRFPTPRLQKEVKNRILTYPGSFNPPHAGHKLLLTHTFFRSASDNVVAAIISPNSTKSVRNKVRNEPDSLVLS